MIATDRLPAILAALCDALTEAEDLVLASGVAQAMDLHALAPLLPVNATDLAIARGLHGLILDGNDGAPLADADRAIACRVAARLASTACLLLAVDPARSLSTAEALWGASGKLSGLWAATHKAAREDERTPTGFTVPTLADIRNEAAKHAKAELWEREVEAQAKLQREALERAGAPIKGVQVGDIIDAKDVPPGTLVECHNKDLVIRLSGGQGWTLDTCGGSGGIGWSWKGGISASVHPVRVLAAGLFSAEADRVAMMTPAEAREWLAQRVASEAV